MKERLAASGTQRQPHSSCAEQQRALLVHKEVVKEVVGPLFGVACCKGAAVCRAVAHKHRSVIRVCCRGAHSQLQQAADV